MDKNLWSVVWSFFRFEGWNNLKKKNLFCFLTITPYKIENSSRTDSSYNPQDDETEEDWSDSSEDYYDFDDEEFDYDKAEEESIEENSL